MAKIDAFFNLMFEQSASDLHLSSGNPPILRIRGELQRVDFPPLENDSLKAMLYEITPEHDRVLSSFPESMGFYLSLRLTMNDADEVEPERARRELDAARGALEARARLVEADYPLIAAGFRRLLEETKDGSPPEDRLWHAMARRIGDRYLPDWLLRAARE